jgi:hypothetical protein
MPGVGTKRPTDWTREQTVLAMALYCRIPFGQCHARNKEVQRFAEIIGRSPGAVARKLGNLARLDPTLSARGVGGLAHGSKMDVEVWEAAHRDWAAFLEESEALLHGRGIEPVEEPEPELAFAGRETEQQRTVMTRSGQAFFRRMVLSSYRSICSVCGVDEPRILVASHIKPWSVDKANRLNPRNGICLCALHDAAFDDGLMTLDDSLRWGSLPPLKGRLAAAPYREFFGRFEGKPMVMPDRWRPDAEFIAWHRVVSYRRCGTC